jgi:hypothetical protein
MTALLNWRVWAAIGLAVLLGASHWKAYTLGEKSVQSDFDAYINKQVAQELASEQDARAKEQAFQTSLENLTNAYITQKNALAAAHNTNGKLLDGFNTALNSPAGKDSPAGSGAHGSAGLEQELLGNCAATLVRLAEEADGLEARLVGLQSYVKSVLAK